MVVERDRHGSDAPAPLGHPGRAGPSEGHSTGPEIGQQFSQAGGTLISLAPTNKHRDEDGESIYSGATDIADDCDCVYVIETIEDDKTSGKRPFNFVMKSSEK